MSETIVAKKLNRNTLHTIPFATLFSETQDNCVILHKWRVSTSSLKVMELLIDEKNIFP